MSGAAQAGSVLPYGVAMQRRSRGWSVARTLALPLITSLILLIPTVLYWAHERSVLAEFQQSRVSQYRVRLAKRIQTEVESQLRPLRRLGGEIVSGDVPSASAFAISARSICREEPTLKFIAWIGPDGKCISAYPPAASSTIAQGMSGSAKEDFNQLFARLGNAPEGMLLAFPTGGSTDAADRIIVLPILHAGPAPGGAIVTCETTKAMLGEMIPPDASAPFIVEVKDERGRILFASDGATLPAAEELLRTADVDRIPVLDQSWAMSLAAAPPGLGQRPASNSDALLLSGLIVSLLGGATVAQAARHRQREQHKTAEHMAVLETALQQQQRLNAQIRLDADAKAMLLRELNHRVKNNLAGIVGLLSAGVPELSEQAQQWLDRAIARIETLARAHELFVGTSSELGLSDLVAKTLEPVYAIKPPKVQIKLDFSTENETLSTDQAVTLAMVVHELASNALQHGVGDHGTICVRAGHVRPGWATIEVIDDGSREPTGMTPGMTPEMAPEMASEIENIGGAVATLPIHRARTGIGLQLVRGLVGRELHGSFSMCENAGGGTTATVEFPIAQANSLERRGDD